MKNAKPIAALAVVAGLLSGSIGAPLWAQNQSDFNQLQTKLKADDQLKVVDRNNKTASGRLVRISGSSLTLLVNGAHQEFSEASIREIKQRRPHGEKNALIGMAIGGLAGGAIAAAAHPGSDSANSPTTTFGVGIGAAIGAAAVGLKHLFTKRYDTVFTARGPSRP